MSDTNDRGLARRRLVLLGLDFSTDSGEGLISECVDEWGRAGLLEDVYFVDLGSRVDASRDSEIADQFQCARPGSDQLETLERVMSKHIWAEITVLSVRLPPLSRVAEDRCEQEERLKLHISKAFPSGSGCQTAFFTLSWLNSEPFSDRKFPGSYTTNLLHDRSIFVGEDLALASFDERNRHLSLAFTALLSAGGFVGQTSSSLHALIQVDGRMGVERAVRPIRAIARAASGGWFFRDALRQAMSRENFIMPGGVVNAIPDSGSPIVIQNLVEQSAEMCGFNYRPYASAKTESKKIGLLRAILGFLKTFPPYLSGAARQTVANRVRTALEPIADALQRVYGQDSIVKVRGTSGGLEAPNSDVAALLEYFRQAALDPEHYSFEPTISPDIWKNLARVTTGSLDGSDLPDQITCLSIQSRLIFNDPAIVAPSPSASVFRLSESDRAVLGVKDSDFREPDLLFPETLDAFRSVCAEAKQDVLFARPQTEVAQVIIHAESSELSGRARLLGPSSTKGGDLSSGSPFQSASHSNSRDVRSIAQEFEKWEKGATDRAKGSFLFKLSEQLQREIESARNDVKVAELRQLLDEMLKADSAKKRSAMLYAVGGVGVVGLVLAFAASQLKWVSIAVLPLLAIWFVVWLFGAACAFGLGVLKQALQNYRADHGRKGENQFEHLFHSITKAIREYIRLRSLQDQFFAWSRILREVIHSPYGALEDESERTRDVTELPHPRQFSIAKVEPQPKQMQFLLNSIRRMVLVRGYLSTVLEGALGVWRETYRDFGLQNINHDPYADVKQTWGHAVSQRQDGRLVYYPLQDFYIELVNGKLREIAARELQGEIERQFNAYEVRDVFGRISDVDPEHLALKDFDPEEYLFGYLGTSNMVPAALRRNFDPNLFNITTLRARELKQSNVDAALSSRWNADYRSLKHFSLRRNRRFIMLTHLVAIGEQATPRDLEGYEPPKPSSDVDHEAWRM